MQFCQVREQILVGGMLRTQLSSLFIAFQGGQDDHCWNPLANAVRGILHSYRKEETKLIKAKKIL